MSSEILSANRALTGFIKIWKQNKQTGESSLVVDKNNTILKGGAKLIARALGGDPNAKIWGMYIGYNNSAGQFAVPGIDLEYSFPFTSFADPYGYLREPLTFKPTFLSSEGYDENTVLFSTMITTAQKAGGADFTTLSKIYEVGLVAVADEQNSAMDTVFSRTNFSPIQYNDNYNFTITWGVRTILPALAL
jgi:hypothetical protein